MWRDNWFTRSNAYRHGRLVSDRPAPTENSRSRPRYRPTFDRLEERTVLTALAPCDFTSLGNLNLLSGSYTINTSGTPTLTGPGTNFTGVVSGGIAVFDFDSVNIGAGVTITAAGTRPL